MAGPPPKPDGSDIEEIEGLDGRTYRWKLPSGGPFRFFIAAFLIFWICAWAVGFVTTTVALLNDASARNGFLAFWLAGWTLGGIFAIFMLYVFLRRPCPESITLKRDSFLYDSGTTPPIAFWYPWYAMRHSNPNEAFGNMFRRRKQIELGKKELGAVVLERIGERQRLYFDHGADRVEIGEHLREPEREWLAEVVKGWQAT